MRKKGGVELRCVRAECDGFKVGGVCFVLEGKIDGWEAIAEEETKSKKVEKVGGESGLLTSGWGRLEVSGGTCFGGGA